MEYTFTAAGHENVLATHATTLEFTRDSALTKRGNCIVTVTADFSLQRLQRFLQEKRVAITIAAGGKKDTVVATPSRSFCNDREIVIRKGTFASERTFAVAADKSSAGLDRRLIKALQQGATATIKITTQQ